MNLQQRRERGDRWVHDMGQLKHSALKRLNYKPPQHPPDPLYIQSNPHIMSKIDGS